MLFSHYFRIFLMLFCRHLPPHWKKNASTYSFLCFKQIHIGFAYPQISRISTNIEFITAIPSLVKDA
ncbi:unknown [Firmicutes bacterium CAG:475]|nr:unknown [Firmicutes bacterium CAG:475]